MPVVMESNRVAIIVVYSGCSNYRTSKITADVFDNCFRVTKIRFGINIEPMFVVSVTFGLDFLKEGPMRDSISFRSAVRKALRR